MKHWNWKCSYFLTPSCFKYSHFSLNAGITFALCELQLAGMCDVTPFFATVAKSYRCQIVIAVEWLLPDWVLSAAKIFCFVILYQILPGHVQSPCRAISQLLPKRRPNCFTTVEHECGTLFVGIFGKKSPATLINRWSNHSCRCTPKLSIIHPLPPYVP